MNNAFCRFTLFIRTLSEEQTESYGLTLTNCYFQSDLFDE